MEKLEWDVTVYILSVNTWLWRQWRVVDLHSRILDVRPPPTPGSIFFQLMQYGEIW